MFCILISLKLHSQVTVVLPLSTVDYTNGAYFKDFDNELLPYVGTWEGILNNKKYTFVFQKFTQHLISSAPLSDNYLYQDLLKGKFEVIELSTGAVIYSSLSAINYEDFPILGVVKPYNGRFDFYFQDTEINCENGLEFSLRNIPSQPNQLKYYWFRYNDWYKSDCSMYSDRMDIPIFLPMQELILTKL